jgi:hypothetical protein
VASVRATRHPLLPLRAVLRLAGISSSRLTSWTAAEADCPAVAAHNAQVPHSAFRGQTPDEMYSGTGEQVPVQIELAKRTALEARLNANRLLSCERCARVPMGTDRTVSAAA